MRAPRRPLPFTLLLLVIVAFVAFGLGRLSVGGGAMAQIQAEDIAATATRTAEQVELEQLRNLISGSPVAIACTQLATETAEPSPTATLTPSVTPTPTPVPPRPAGTPIEYPGDWVVIVDDITLMPTFRDEVAEGIFAQVSLTVTNNTSDPRRFPYKELVLLDAQGRPFITPIRVISGGGSGWHQPFPPSLPTPGMIIFDIATDSTGPFILESTVDPTFRVEVSLQNRG